MHLKDCTTDYTSDVLKRDTFLQAHSNVVEELLKYVRSLEPNEVCSVHVVSLSYDEVNIDLQGSIFF